MHSCVIRCYNVVGYQTYCFCFTFTRFLLFAKILKFDISEKKYFSSYLNTNIKNENSFVLQDVIMFLFISRTRFKDILLVHLLI